MTATGRTPTARELVAAKQGNAAKTLDGIKAAAPKTAPKAPTAMVKAAASTAVAIPDTRDYRERYLDEVAPASIVGRMLKFSREGQFVTHDDGQTVADDAEFIVLADQTLVGWLKFGETGEPPAKEMGLLYDGYQMPPRESLGDLGPSKWEEGLDGQPTDPWQHHQYLVLQKTDTAELFTFTTSSKTGRRAVGTLLRHYNRMQRTHPDEFPVVKLRAGGFAYRDERIGWVPVPTFTVIGRAPRDSVARPDTSIAAFIGDVLPL